MQNVKVEETQAEIKSVGRNINNLRYADDTTFMAESQEELKSLLMNVKEETEAGLKLNIEKMKIMAYCPITWWQINRKTMEIVRDFTSWTPKITADCDYKGQFLLGRNVMTKLDNILKSRDINLLTRSTYSKL